MNRLLMIALVVSSLMGGCDSNTLGFLADDSGKQADIEEARIAVDNGSYDKAIRLLQDRYNPATPDPEVAGILASAYMGRAGIDLTYILENIGGSYGGHFDIIASALRLPLSGEDNARFIPMASLDDRLQSLERARSVLTARADHAHARGSASDDDAVVQRGIASALHFIMKTGALLGEFMGTDAPASQSAYQRLITANSDPAEQMDGLATYIDARPEDLVSLKTDLADIYEAVIVLIEKIGSDEDITRELEGFLCDLLGISRGSPEQSVTTAIHAYTGRSFTRFVQTTLIAYD